LLDDVLDPVEDATVAEHVEGCVPCQHQLERMIAAGGESGRVPPVSGLPAPGAAAGALLDRLKRAGPESETLRPGSAGVRSAVADCSPKLPEVPGYEVLEELGRGGMGVVYKARQTNLNRLVALKMIHSDAGDKDVARFRTEAEAIARLQHPNIVQVYDVGAVDGRLYLALEFVAGGTLKQRLTGTPLPPREAAALTEVVARAAEFAHRQGILHRDLKPANILLAREGEAPAEPAWPRAGAGGSAGASPSRAAGASPSLGMPKIADFGLAKLFGGEAVTHSGEVLGTPGYMSPEQARAGAEVGPATDVYALGAVLYELLTGHAPFNAPTPVGTLLQVLHEEPVSVSRLQPKTPRDLATVVHKCLEKRPAHRYAGAAALADDLHRFLSGQPIQARPAGGVERTWKWARRRPAVAGLLAAIILVTLLSVGLIAWGWQQALASSRAEAGARAEAERLLARATFDRAETLCERGEVGHGLLWLARCLDRAVRAGDADLERVVRVNLANWRYRFVARRALLPHAQWTTAVAFSPGGDNPRAIGRFVATGGKEGTARLWDATTGEPVGAVLAHRLPVWVVAFSPDGRTLATGCGAENGSEGEVRLWEVPGGDPLGPAAPLGGGIQSLAFNRDGSGLLVLRTGQGADGDGKAQLWATADLRAVAGRAGNPTPRFVLPHPPSVLVAAFSPDGQRVLTGGIDGTARLWNAVTGKARGEPLRLAGPVVAAGFTPDGNSAAAASLVTAKNGAVLYSETQLWDLETGRPRGKPLPQPGRLLALALSPDGKLLLTGSAVAGTEPSGPPRGEARLWDVTTGEPAGPPLGHSGVVRAVAFSPDGGLLATGCEDRTAHLWLAGAGVQLGPGLGSAGTVGALAFSPDGRTLATGSLNDQDGARLWTVPPAQADAHPLRLGVPVGSMALGPDGRTLLTPGRSGDQWGGRLWDVTGRQLLRQFGRHRDPVQTVALSADGKLAATGGPDATAQLWDAGTGVPVGPLLRPFGGVLRLAFSPDGRALLVQTEYATQCWRLPVGRPPGQPVDFHAGARVAAFTPDGGKLLTANSAGLQWWEVSAARRVGHFQQSEEDVSALAYSPGGELYATGSAKGLGQLWHTDTNEPAVPPFHHQEAINALSFSRDGRTLLTASSDRTARLWDVTTGLPLGPPLPHRDRVLCGTVLPDTGRVLAGCADGTVPFWDVQGAWPGDPEQVRLGIEVLTGMELDGHDLFRVLGADDRQQRRQRLRPCEL
jgi:WD40 repeat protein/serine/threonine protein kinase